MDCVFVSLFVVPFFWRPLYFTISSFPLMKKVKVTVYLTLLKRVSAITINLLNLKQEGSSQARYFASRLIPAHKDPPYEQVSKKEEDITHSS